MCGITVSSIGTFTLRVSVRYSIRSSVAGVSSGAPFSRQSGISSSSARVSITAPDRMCAPTSPPFSTRQTEIPGSSCLARIAAASPAGPPPTTTTSNSIASRSDTLSHPRCHCLWPVMLLPEDAPDWQSRGADLISRAYAPISSDQRERCRCQRCLVRWRRTVAERQVATALVTLRNSIPAGASIPAASRSSRRAGTFAPPTQVAMPPPDWAPDCAKRQVNTQWAATREGRVSTAKYPLRPPAATRHAACTDPGMMIGSADAGTTLGNGAGTGRAVEQAPSTATASQIILRARVRISRWHSRAASAFAHGRRRSRRGRPSHSRPPSPRRCAPGNAGRRPPAIRGSPR